MEMADAPENVCETLLTLALPLTQIAPKADSLRLVVTEKAKLTKRKQKLYSHQCTTSGHLFSYMHNNSTLATLSFTS